MAQRPKSVGYAAAGFIPHRFVRAAVSATVLLWLIGTQWEYWLNYVTEPNHSIIVIDSALVLSLLALFVGGLLIDWLHRRVVALAALAFFLYAIGFIGWLLHAIAMRLLGRVDEPAVLDQGSYAFAVMAVVAVYFAVRGAVWAIWQLSASREDFMAVRGWRPRPLAWLSNFRRHLGMPAFLATFGRGGISLGLLFFLIAALNTGIILIFYLPSFLTTAANARSGPAVYIAIATAVLLLLNILGAGRLIAWFANKRATRIYQNVREWDPRAPVVFLRAFDQDDARLPVVVHDPLLKLPAGVATAKTLDEVLLEHASPYGPLIAIGDPRDPTPPLGAARVFVPGEGIGWQDVVRSLIGSAKAVVMCPTSSEGVRWELALLQEAGAAAKTIYLANPEIDAAESTTLFAALRPEIAHDLKHGQVPIAAFEDPTHGWRVLSAKRLDLASYTAALNIALQSLFGLEGEPMPRPAKQARA